MKKTFCKHESLSPLFEVPVDVKSGRETQFGKVVQCRECGLRLVSPLPTTGQIPEHYDLPSYYTHGESHIQDRPATLSDRVIMKLAWWTDRGTLFDPESDHALPKHAATALDIGCGHGELLSRMHELDLQTFGIDPDPAARAEAGALGHKVFAGTAEDMPEDLHDQTFDMITMTHVLEHCRDPVLALRNVAERLSDHGHFYCEVPNAGALHFETYGPISEMLDIPRHLYFFEQSDLDRLFAESGLEVIRWKFHGLTRHFSPGWKAWENQIHDVLCQRGAAPQCAKRSGLGDLGLLLRGMFQAPAKRYDCIGVLARKAR